MAQNDDHRSRQLPSMYTAHDEFLGASSGLTHDSSHPQHCTPSNDLLSPTDALPDEVLSQIFQALILSSIEDDGLSQFPPQFTLGAVSARWRRVVWHTRNLWEIFSMKVTASTLPNVVSMLRVCNENRGVLKGYVALDMGGIDPNASKTPRELLDELGSAMFLSADASNFHSLQLHRPPTYWLRSLRKNCSSLHHLRLSWHPWWPDAATGDRGPWRKELRVQLPWQNFTTLSIHCVPVNVCIELLKGCPDLTCFESYNIQNTAGNHHPPFGGQENSPITILTKLQCLKWDSQQLGWGPLLGWDAYLLGFLEFPALQHIAWAFPPAERSSRNTFSQFISRTTHHIDTFELIGSHLVIPWFKSLLDILGPRLCNVICTGFPPSALPQILSMFEQNIIHFPVLRSLKFASARRDRMESSLFIESINNLARQRKQGGTGKFYFEVENLNVVWSLPDRALMSQVKGDGFHLVIKHDGSSMDL
ncbi:hypothetical protein D9756_008191 [Leucocoprinus leucothites]|uniref:F-box domain-containing protein n=1 Tax=Leucocoprinus leucothites TaxID=201217 RepID=A0A8H5CZT0_9AGAR|nr:hypothetical protein D9756_008191 [Leucoagaricus leucothites]